MHKRIQRSRAPGWKKPAGAVYVGRPTKWGNVHPIGTQVLRGDGSYRPLTRDEAIARWHVEVLTFKLLRPDEYEEWIAPLRGHDLMCWCPLHETCHADILLELAAAT